MSPRARHASHGAVARRLKRAEGHLRNVIEMIEGGRACLDIAQQLHAVEKAIAATKKVLILDHIDHCLERAVGPASRKHRQPIEEFKQITKYA